MSFRAVVWALDQTTGSPLSKLVLIKLADSAKDSDGRCFPSFKTIAKETEMSRESVKRHIRILEQKGLIKIQRKILNGANLSNDYWLPAEQWLGRVTETPLGSERPQGRVTETPGVGSERAPNLEDRTYKKNLIEIESSTAKPRTDKELIDYCRSKGLMGSDGEWLWAKMEANGWKNGGKPVKVWRSLVVQWRIQKIFPSQKESNQRKFNQI